MKDLRTLPKVRDSWSYLYVERCRIEQEGKAIALIDERGTVPIPCANLNLLMLGPGSTVTHAAMRALAENGCLVAWTGEGGVRFYASALGETRSARRLLHQAHVASNRRLRMETIMRMYRMRFGASLPEGLNLRQIRGHEGRRVRRAYEEASAATGVPWSGRLYRASNWAAADPINRALSVANSCLYGICHAAIVAAGYSPAIGFIHTGHMTSFVYDIADLYKTEITIPIAFRVVAETGRAAEREVRAACRDHFYRTRLLERIVPDIAAVLGEPAEQPVPLELDVDEGRLVPGWLWDEDGLVRGGTNYASEGNEGGGHGSAGLDP